MKVSDFCPATVQSCIYDLLRNRRKQRHLRNGDPANSIACSNPVIIRASDPRKVFTVLVYMHSIAISKFEFTNFHFVAIGRARKMLDGYVPN